MSECAPVSGVDGTGPGDQWQPRRRRGPVLNDGPDRSDGPESRDRSHRPVPAAGTQNCSLRTTMITTHADHTDRPTVESKRVDQRRSRAVITAPASQERVAQLREVAA